MRIELQYPYSEDWRFGYLVTNKEPRRNVILFNSEQDRSTVSYARYLMAVEIGEYISPDLVVDHINGDKLDDRIENYQLLTNQENVAKGTRQNNTTAQLVDLICGTCGCEFTKPRNQTHLVIDKKSTYCSHSCSGKRLAPSTILREYRK